MPHLFSIISRGSLQLPSAQPFLFIYFQTLHFVQIDSQFSFSINFVFFFFGKGTQSIFINISKNINFLYIIFQNLLFKENLI